MIIGWTSAIHGRCLPDTRAATATSAATRTGAGGEDAPGSTATCGRLLASIREHQNPVSDDLGKRPTWEY